MLSIKIVKRMKGKIHIVRYSIDEWYTTYCGLTEANDIVASGRPTCKKCIQSEKKAWEKHKSQLKKLNLMSV